MAICFCRSTHTSDLKSGTPVATLRPLRVDRLVGLVVKASASRAEGPGFESRLRRDFFGVESYQSLKHWYSSGYPAGAWYYRVSAGTGWPGVSIL